MGSKSKSEIVWDITTKRYVGFLDIMGFKDLVSRNSPEKVYKIMKRVVDVAKKSLNTYGHETYNDMILYDILRISIYSDSIIICTKDNSRVCMDLIVGALSSIYEDLLKNSIPVKGALAHGSMTLDYRNSIFFGQPLIDAFLLQEEIAYYGILVHNSAEGKKGIENHPCIMEYIAPLKKGKSNHLSIYPQSLDPEFLEGTKSYDKIKKGTIKLRLKTSGNLRTYIDSTLEYLNWINDNSLKTIKKWRKYRKNSSGLKEEDLPF